MASTATYALNKVGSAFGRADSQHIEHRIDVVCDSTLSAVDSETIPIQNSSVMEIKAVAVKMPATAYPNSVTVTIKDANGVQVFTGTIAGAASKAERIELSDGSNTGSSASFGPWTVTHTGNTTASATWSTYILGY